MQDVSESTITKDEDDTIQRLSLKCPFTLNCFHAWSKKTPAELEWRLCRQHLYVILNALFTLTKLGNRL
jgi:hypothetical protein